MRQYIEFENGAFRLISSHTRDTYNGFLRFISDSEEGSCIPAPPGSRTAIRLRGSSKNKSSRFTRLRKTSNGKFMQPR